MSRSAQFPRHTIFPNLHDLQGFSYSYDILIFPARATLISPSPFNKKIHILSHNHLPYLASPLRLSTSDNCAPQPPPLDDAKDEEPQNKAFSTKDAFLKLKRYGSCGILAYGLLNTAYYITTFLVVWFYVAPSPAKIGYLAAVQRFAKVMAMVWAGSQVTKLARVAGAIGLAPIVEKALSWSSNKFKFHSQARAYMTIVGICIGMALVLFLAVTIMWA